MFHPKRPENVPGFHENGFLRKPRASLEKFEKKPNEEKKKAPEETECHETQGKRKHAPFDHTATPQRRPLKDHGVHFKTVERKKKKKKKRTMRLTMIFVFFCRGRARGGTGGRHPPKTTTKNTISDLGLVISRGCGGASLEWFPCDAFTITLKCNPTCGCSGMLSRQCQVAFKHNPAPIRADSWSKAVCKRTMRRAQVQRAQQSALSSCWSRVIVHTSQRRLKCVPVTSKSRLSRLCLLGQQGIFLRNPLLFFC